MEEHTRDELKLRAQFKAWKDKETNRILCCTWASPEGIQHMWENLKLQEETFERSLAHQLQQTSTRYGHQVQCSLNIEPPKDTKEELEPLTINPEFIKPKTLERTGESLRETELNPDSQVSCLGCSCHDKFIEQHDSLRACSHRLTKL